MDVRGCKQRRLPHSRAATCEHTLCWSINSLRQRSTCQAAPDNPSPPFPLPKGKVDSQRTCSGNGSRLAFAEEGSAWDKVCTALTTGAAVAASVLIPVFLAPPTNAYEQRATHQLAVERRLLEELLLDNAQIRLKSLSDEELLKLFKDVVQSKVPAVSTAESSPASSIFSSFTPRLESTSQQSTLPASTEASVDSKPRSEEGPTLSTPEGRSPPPAVITGSQGNPQRRIKKEGNEQQQFRGSEDPALVNQSSGGQERASSSSGGEQSPDATAGLLKSSGVIVPSNAPAPQKDPSASPSWADGGGKIVGAGKAAAEVVGGLLVSTVVAIQNSSFAASTLSLAGVVGLAILLLRIISSEEEEEEEDGTPPRTTRPSGGTLAPKQRPKLPMFDLKPLTDVLSRMRQLPGLSLLSELIRQQASERAEAVRGGKQPQKPRNEPSSGPLGQFAAFASEMRRRSPFSVETSKDDSQLGSQTPTRKTEQAAPLGSQAPGASDQLPRAAFQGESAKGWDKSMRAGRPSTPWPDPWRESEPSLPSGSQTDRRAMLELHPKQQRNGPVFASTRPAARIQPGGVLWRRSSPSNVSALPSHQNRRQQNGKRTAEASRDFGKRAEQHREGRQQRQLHRQPQFREGSAVVGQYPAPTHRIGNPGGLDNLRQTSRSNRPDQAVADAQQPPEGSFFTAETSKAKHPQVLPVEGSTGVESIDEQSCQGRAQAERAQNLAAEHVNAQKLVWQSAAPEVPGNSMRVAGHSETLDADADRVPREMSAIASASLQSQPQQLEKQHVRMEVSGKQEVPATAEALRWPVSTDLESTLLIKPVVRDDKAGGEQLSKASGRQEADVRATADSDAGGMATTSSKAEAGGTQGGASAEPESSSREGTTFLCEIMTDEGVSSSEDECCFPRQRDRDAFRQRRARRKKRNIVWDEFG